MYDIIQFLLLYLINICFSKKDAYVRKYNLIVTPSCSESANLNIPDTFYTSNEAIQDFKNRIEHILTHVNPYFRKPWSDLPEVIFSIQPENEPRFEANPNWMENVTSYIKVLAPSLLVSSGGPSGGLPKPSPDTVASIPSVDLLSLHNYSNNITEELLENRKAAVQYNKRFFLEEFGFGNYNNSQNQALRYTVAIDQARIIGETPWMFWMLGPAPSENSLNIFPGNLAYDTVVQPEAINASQQLSQQSWPEIW